MLNADGEKDFNPRGIKYDIEEIERGDFHIGKDSDHDGEQNPCKTLVCSVCKSDRFIVGSNNYFTAVKCTVCGYECCIHQG